MQYPLLLGYRSGVLLSQRPLVSIDLVPWVQDRSRLLLAEVGCNPPPLCIGGVEGGQLSSREPGLTHVLSSCACAYLVKGHLVKGPPPSINSV